MAIKINPHISSMNVGDHLKKVQRGLQTATAKLASGNRIQQAGQDAAGLAIGTRLDAEIRGFAQSMRAVSDGISIAKTAEGAQGQIMDSLQRIKELAVQAGNGAMNDSDLAAIQKEIDGLVDQINQIGQGTDFNGKALLDGSFSISVDVGGDEAIDVEIDDAQAAALGIDTLDVSTLDGVSNALDAVDGAMAQISSMQAYLGATMNHFEHSLNHIRTNMTNLAESRSRIMDTDYGSETARETLLKIQQEGDMSLLGRIHDLAPKTVFSLLE